MQLQLYINRSHQFCKRGLRLVHLPVLESSRVLDRMICKFSPLSHSVVVPTPGYGQLSGTEYSYYSQDYDDDDDDDDKLLILPLLP